MRHATKLIGVSAAIAAMVAVATIASLPTNRTASYEEVQGQGSSRTRLARHAIEQFGRPGGGGRMCWYDPDVPRCD